MCSLGVVPKFEMKELAELQIPSRSTPVTRYGPARFAPIGYGRLNDRFTTRPYRQHRVSPVRRLLRHKTTSFL